MHWDNGYNLGCGVLDLILKFQAQCIGIMATTHGAQLWADQKVSSPMHWDNGYNSKATEIQVGEGFKPNALG